MAKPKGKKQKSGKGRTVLIVIGVIVGLIFVALIGNFAWSKVSGFLDKDDGGDNETVEEDIHMPIAKLEADKDKARVAEPITFDANKSYVPEYTGNLSSSGILFYTFDFGYTDNEGNRAAETLSNATTIHQFPERGQFKITLTVEDELGYMNSTSLIIEIVPPDLPISTSTTVLIGDPLGPGVIGNTTELDWNLAEGATYMWLNITITGANVREGQQNEVELILEDPRIDVIKNDTVHVLGQRLVEWTFDADEIAIEGKYNLIIRAASGAAMVNVVGAATYI